MLDIIMQISALTLAFNLSSWKQTLPVMAIGMVGIFLVIGVIILCTYGLNKLFSSKKDKDSQDKE